MVGKEDPNISFNFNLEPNRHFGRCLFHCWGLNPHERLGVFFSHPRVSCVAFLLLIVLDLLNFQTLLLTLLAKETKLGSLTIPSVQTVTPKVSDRWTFLKVIFASIF